MLPEHIETNLDSVDVAILAALRRDGRVSVERLSQSVHLSRPAVHERVRRLEARGVIRGYTARIDWGAIGLPIVAYIAVRASGGRYSETAESIARIASAGALIEEVHRITGEWCYFVKVRAASAAALEHLIDDIRDLPAVGQTMTTMVLSTIDPPLAHGLGQPLNVAQ